MQNLTALMSKFTVYMRAAAASSAYYPIVCTVQPSCVQPTTDKFSPCRRVKHSLVSETFNIVGFHPPHGLVSKHQVPKRWSIIFFFLKANIKSLLGTDTVDHLPRMLTHDPRVYSKALTAEDDAKEKEHEGASLRGPRKHNIRLLQALTPRDVKILVQAEEELSQTKVFCLPNEASFVRFLI